MEKKNYRRKFLNFPNLIVDRHSRKYKDKAKLWLVSLYAELSYQVVRFCFSCGCKMTK